MLSSDTEALAYGRKASRPLLAQRLKSRYDAVVFGTGPAASVFAIEMARHDKAVLLVPNVHQKVSKPLGETLAPRGEFLLRQMGIAEKCLAGHCPTDFVLSSWRDPRLERIEIGFDPHGRMWCVNRLSFDEILLNHAAAIGADSLDRNRHNQVRFDRTDLGWTIHLDSADVLTTTYLVDATGRSAAIARSLGSRRLVNDRLVALFCLCDQTQETKTLLIEAVRGGWWYSLPLPAGMLLLAFMTDPGNDRVSKRRRRNFCEAMLNEAPHTRVRAGSFAEEPGVAYVESARLDRMSGDDWIAIGDAATTFDPLSSHGLTSAIEQGVEAARLLSARADRSALSALDSKRVALFEKYRSQRANFYHSVERFSGQAFWQNRVLQ
jgi:flavin-dependent dehydrogenase